MRLRLASAALAVALLAANYMCAQDSRAAPAAAPTPPARAPWEISLTIDGYLLPDQDSYANPTAAADHGWLHLEARYNYEDRRTGSLWVGYNFSAGKQLVLNITPMVGGVFGRTTGVAPGCEASRATNASSCRFRASMCSTSATNQEIFTTAGRSWTTR